MAVAGIIAEFNPFHSGHRSLIETVRAELRPRAVVCVMSGNFVQRGQPAVADKFARASACILCGADLALELPVCFALSAASDFAFGGVRTLGALGLVTHLCFGSESGDAAALGKLARLSHEDDPAFVSALKERLSGGENFGTAYTGALKAVAGPKTGLCCDLWGPNDLLAREYAKAVENGGFSMELFAVRRTGARHDSPEAQDGSASASAIRELMRAGNAEAAARYVPEKARFLVERGCGQPVMEARVWDMLRYRISFMTGEDLAGVPGVSEGLENVIKREAARAESFSDLVERCRSRRYARGRMRRIFMNILLGTDKDLLDKCKREPAYCRVLAFNETGASLIKESASSGAPVFVNPNRAAAARAQSPSGTSADMRASEIYGMLSGRTLYESSDAVNIPKILRFS